MPMPDRESQRKYQRQWMRRRRDRWLRANGPCAECGSAERLEVDHVDPASKVDHRLWSWTKARRDAELKKCQVLCHACHRRKCAEECRGEKSATAKLGERAVRRIHALHREGEIPASLARRFEISHRQVARILAGERWAHVYDDIHSRRSA